MPRKDIVNMHAAMQKIKNPIKNFIKKKRREKLANEIDRSFDYMEKNPQITHFGWVRGKADKLKKKNKI